jgi:hypothetical protein
MDRNVTDILRPWARRLRRVRAAEAAGRGAVVGGAVAVAAMVAAMLLGREQAALWAALALPAGAVVGAAHAILAGVSPLAAARFLDRRCGLRERLATAVELEAKGDATAAGEHVRRQARQAVAALPKRLPLWTLGPRAAAAMMVAAVLVAALAAVAVVRREDTPIRRLLGMLDGATQARREAVAESLRQAGDRAESVQTAEQLRRAARLVELDDEEQLREVLERLERAGFEVGPALPGDVAAELGMGDAEGAAGGDRESRGDLAAGEGEAVRVFDPAYARAAGEAGENAAAAGATMSFGDAWSAARERAAASLNADRVPAEYRPIVRRFYEEKPLAQPLPKSTPRPCGRGY